MSRSCTGGWVISIRRVWVFCASETARAPPLRTVSGCDVCVVGRAQQLANPEMASHKINRSFQLCDGDLIGLFTPVAPGVYKYVSNITVKYTKRTAVDLMTKDHTLQSLQLFTGTDRSSGCTTGMPASLKR